MAPLMFLVILVAIAAIAVVIYYSVKEDDTSPKESTTDVNWVAVGNDGGGTSFGNIMYSADGKEWQETTTGASFASFGNGVAYGTSDGTNPLWVAVGRDSGNLGRENIMYSENGKVWQETTVGSSFAFSGRGVAYGTSDGTNPLWVAVGDDYDGNLGWGNIMYSENGKEWQESTGMSFSFDGHGIAYGTSDGTNPLWVAVGDDFGDNRGWGNILYSENGKVWQETTTGASFATQGNGVAYGTSNGTEPLWVAVGYDGGGNGNIMYSENGKEWQESTGLSFAFSCKGVAYSVDENGLPLWVATGEDTATTGPGKTLYSINGKEWQLSTGSSFAIRGNGVASKRISNIINSKY